MYTALCVTCRGSRHQIVQSEEFQSLFKVQPAPATKILSSAALTVPLVEKARDYFAPMMISSQYTASVVLTQVCRPLAVGRWGSVCL